MARPYRLRKIYGASAAKPLYSPADSVYTLNMERAGRRLPWLRHAFSFKVMEVDHILPRSRGGTDHVENLQLLCAHCNRSKGNKTMAKWRAASEA